MKITEAKFTRRFTTGQYEFEEHTLTCRLEEGSDEKGADILLQLKEEVLEAHAGVKTSESEEQPEEETTEKKKEAKNGKSKSPTVKNNKKNGKAAAEEAEGSDDESAEDDEASDPEASDDDNDNSEGSEDDGEAGEQDSEDAEDKKDESEDDESKPTSGKSGKAVKGKVESKESTKEGKKAFKRKPQHYDRSIEQHKESFSGVLRTVAPNWKDSAESKQKAKKVSERVEGEPFLDENGEILPEFVTKVRKLMK